MTERGLDLREGFESALLRAIPVRSVLAPRRDVVRLETGLAAVRSRLIACIDGHLFVTTGDGRLLGIITLADPSEAVFETATDALVCAHDLARSRAPFLVASDNLETALSLHRETGESTLPVVRDADGMTYLGCVHERDVMAAYNRALLESRREERND